jgi:hypothetical protein
MKNISKTIFVIAFAAMAFFGISVASANAGTVFNTNPLDYATTTVSNYTQNPGCSTCWSPSVTMAPGEVVSVRVYYHNTGNEAATDTRIRISPQNNPAVNSKIFAGGVWSANANLVMGYATVSIPGTPQTITYIPGTAALFPEHTTTPQYLNATQEAALFSTPGVPIGTILQDSTCPSTQTFCHQGSLVARFRIGTTIPPVVYECNDGNDNDNDGLTDFPQDPGCTSPTDNSEYNYVPPVVYVCSDGNDNDNDGLTDYPNDPGCYGPTDNDEFNTIIIQPYVTASTQPATNVTQSSATLNGTFGTNQSTATTWFEWGTSQSLGNQTSVQNMNTASGNFSAFISGLQANTTYHFRACADTNATAPNCGSILTFMTVAQPVNPPSVTTIAGNCNATSNSFMVFGSFASNGTNSTTTWFQYGTTYALGLQIGNQVFSNNSGNFNYNITGLNPNTTYYFQAVAQNQSGTAYGTILSCTTTGQIIPPPPQASQPPVVTTVPASDIAQTSARLNAYLNNIGFTPCQPVGSLCMPNPATSVWFEWGTTPSLGQSSPHQVVSSTTTFNQGLTNLTPNTAYYFRAMAQNSNGTATGNILSFMTAPVGVGPQIIYVNTNTGGSGPVVMLKIESDFPGACLGDSIHYKVTYQNLTNKRLKDVIVQVIMPKEETFVRASRGSYSDTANTLTVLVGDLAGREKGTFDIETTVNSRSKTNDTLVTTATLVYTNPTTLVQGDAIAYSLLDVTCGSNLGAMAIFGGSIGCIGWLLIILIILLAIYLARRNYRY